MTKGGPQISIHKTNKSWEYNVRHGNNSQYSVTLYCIKSF